MQLCIVCGNTFTNPGRKCNACRGKIWRQNNREKDLAQRRAYNKRRWQKVKPLTSEKKCDFCGKVFMPDRHTPKQPYCSAKCRMVSYRQVNREKVNRWRRESYQRHKNTKAETDAKYKDKLRFSGNRVNTLERDKYTCQMCETKESLIVHHIDKTGQADNPNNNLDNLLTLCKSCHRRIHNQI